LIGEDVRKLTRWGRSQGPREKVGVRKKRGRKEVGDGEGLLHSFLQTGKEGTFRKRKSQRGECGRKKSRAGVEGGTHTESLTESTHKGKKRKKLLKRNGRPRVSMIRGGNVTRSVIIEKHNTG